MAPPLLFLFVEPRRDVSVTPRGAVSQCLTVLADVSGVNQRHHVFVPALGSGALMQRSGPGGEKTVGHGAPDGETDGDGSPVVTVLLDLAVVDSTVRQLSLTN